MKRALILEGGGAKGAYQAGAILAFNKKKIFFDAVGGTSIGAINAAFYVSKNFSGMIKLWMKLDSKDLFDIDSELLDKFVNYKMELKDAKNGFSTLHKLIKTKGIDTKDIRNVLNKNLKEDRFFRSKIDFALCTYNFSDKKPLEIYKEDMKKGLLTEYVLSSAYLPFFKLEKIIDNKYYLDGGFYLECPVKLFLNKGYDEEYVVRLWHNKKIEYEKDKNTKLHIITPREDLGSIVLFDNDIAEYRMNLGYYDTLKYLDNLDGNKYYFKHNTDEYYNNLFDTKTYKKILEMYNNSRVPKNNKDFIFKILEQAMQELKYERFKIYNLPYLITSIKYKMVSYKTSKYYYFIKNIKVDFE